MRKGIKKPAAKAKFKVGDKVRKPLGYVFIGNVVAVFSTNAGEWRFVVEHSVVHGLLHIFNDTQLEKSEGK